MHYNNILLRCKLFDFMPILMHCIVLYIFIVLYCIVYIVLCCIRILYCVVLYCIVLKLYVYVTIDLQKPILLPITKCFHDKKR